MLVGGTTIGGIALLFAQYAQLVVGLSPLRAGRWMLPYAIAMLAGSMLAPLLARRVTPGYVVAGGMVVAAVGYSLIGLVGSAGGLGLAVLGLVLVYLGFGPGAVLGTDLAIGAAPPQRAGSASSISETSTELGVALGVALLGSVGTAVYRSAVAAAIPVGLPGDAGAAAAESLAGATVVAEQLPEPAGAALLEAARGRVHRWLQHRRRGERRAGGAPRRGVGVAAAPGSSDDGAAGLRRLAPTAHRAGAC